MYFSEPSWLKIACDEEVMGIHEIKTLDLNSSRIIDYIASTPSLAKVPYKVWDKVAKKDVNSGKMMSEVDETSWCGCFVNWCLAKAKMHAPKYTRAKDWLKYGTDLQGEPKLGAVTVLYHRPTKAIGGMTHSGYHVAFYIGGTADKPALLGGNQSDSVCRKHFTTFHVEGYLWPIPAK
jgi:uncharacterized protein (TIGR02594 family)